MEWCYTAHMQFQDKTWSLTEPGNAKSKSVKARILMVLALLVTAVGASACGAGGVAPAEPASAYRLPIQEREIEAGDVTLHMRTAGEPEAGEVLITIHGGPGNSSDYMLSLEQLASEGLAIVSYDQRGTGRSSEPSGGYGMPNYVADLEVVRQAVGAEAIHLLGHSWGGLVALRYAAAHPERVKSVILMGSGVLTPVAAQAGQRNRSQRIADLQEQGAMPKRITSMSELLPAYFSDPDFEMPDELRNMAYKPDVEQMTWSALEGYDFSEGLDALEQPVLVLWGEDDPFGLAYVDATRQTCLAAELETIILSECGHYWHECPGESLSQVRAFLGSRIGLATGDRE
jgi:proline iminopeptidase